ncbi:hypothetical protein GCM10019059_37790 [Camelimonas fluminis]|uniref:Uncharacterized protein n=1 Tax=Camelimonas fluminis TaxID=1576911 RepID=A0ABV7UNC9_9HYPH|nr:hypothetical protein [Camelimonas fluminis]GHE74700.1 hypothetical protein GCM10019059_37790 [Camelimonas fluminis]
MTWLTDTRATPFVRYDPATGEVLETGNMAIGAVRYLEQQTGWSYLTRPARLGLDYVDLATKSIAERTPCPAALDGATLHNLPAPCTVIVTDAAGAQTDIAADAPDLALVFDFPGAYAVSVRCVPHIDGEFSLEV